jgi:hypothetical protein
VLPRFCSPTRPRGVETIGVDTDNEVDEEKDEDESKGGAKGARECVIVSREASLALFVF